MSRSVVRWVVLLLITVSAVLADTAKVEWVDANKVDVVLQSQGGFVIQFLNENFSQSSLAYTFRQTVDIRTVGLNGLDTGLPENERWYFVYLVGGGGRFPNEVGGAILSKAQNYSDVVMPSGTSTLRRIPFAVFREATGAFRRFRTAPGSSAVSYTDFETSAKFSVLGQAGDTSFRRVDLSRLVPPGAQLASLVYTASESSGGSQSVFLRTPGSASAGYIVASVTPAQPLAVGHLEVETDASQGIEFGWNASGGLLSLFVKGFQFTDLQ